MLRRKDLTFATLIRTRASALTAGSAIKSSMASDNFLFRFWPWARRHTENRGGLRKNPQVRLAALDVIPAYNALKHGEKLILPRALRFRHRVGELVATAIRTPTLFIARTNSSTSGRKGAPPEAGYSACSRNGKTSSTRMSIPKCSGVIRAKSGASGAAAAAAGDGVVAAAARAGRAAGGGDEGKRGRRVPRLRRRFALVSRNSASLGVVFYLQGSAVGRDSVQGL
jgi:hypothetical protein